MAQDKVINCHPDYERYLPQWQKISDCLAGVDQVRAQAQRHLPRLR